VLFSQLCCIRAGAGGKPAGIGEDEGGNWQEENSTTA